jgi:hypothetical protein
VNNIANAAEAMPPPVQRRSLHIVFASTSGHTQYVVEALIDSLKSANLQQARALATRVQDRIACGILYQREDIPHFYSRLIPRQGLETTCVEEVRRYDVSEYSKQLV